LVYWFISLLAAYGVIVFVLIFRDLATNFIKAFSLINIFSAEEIKASYKPPISQEYIP